MVNAHRIVHHANIPAYFEDDCDTRGRWRNSRRQHETYADTSIPFVDAKVAAAVCKGGPIAYVVDEESCISDCWILDHVTPHMARCGIPKATKSVIFLGPSPLGVLKPPLFVGASSSYSIARFTKCPGEHDIR